MKTASDSFTRLRTALASLLVAVPMIGIGGVGCGVEQDARATADLIGPEGERVGTVTFRKLDEGILMMIEAEGLPPGEHGIHIHERGECATPQFESAGGHFAPDSQNHGFFDRNVDGMHVGDLENLLVDDAGRARAFRVIEGATLDADADAGSASLLRENGTAVMIHMGPDDYRTDPAGASGPRIACGVITASGS